MLKSISVQTYYRIFRPAKSMGKFNKKAIWSMCGLYNMAKIRRRQRSRNKSNYGLRGVLM